MIVRALDAQNDWTFGRGKGNYLSRNKAIAQNIQTRLSSFLGDCFWDISAGIDWFNLLGSKDIAELNLAVSTIIINTAEVTKLLQLSVTLDSERDLRLSYEVETVYTGLVTPNATIQDSSKFLITEDGFTIITEDGRPIVT